MFRGRGRAGKQKREEENDNGQSLSGIRPPTNQHQKKVMRSYHCLKEKGWAGYSRLKIVSGTWLPLENTQKGKNTLGGFLKMRRIRGRGAWVSRMFARKKRTSRRRGRLSQSGGLEPSN